MLFDDLKFVNQLSSRMRNFHQRDSYLWNFSCPLCGDSEKDHKKARGYIYRLDGKLNYKCHNCGASTTFQHFLKQVDTRLYNEYLLSKYSKEEKPEPNLDLFKERKVVDPSNPLGRLQSVAELSLNHPAAIYLGGRKLPLNKWGLLYHCEKFVNFTHHLLPGKLGGLREHPRLLIPSFDASGRLIGYSGRSYNPKDKQRYIDVKLDESAPSIFGLERLNPHQRTLVLEGQIDSLFLPNAIAVQGSSFDIPFVRSLADSILVMDNEPRNAQIMNQLHNYIQRGFRVCIWEGQLPGKDINAMILAGMSASHINHFIQTHHYQGLEAMVKFSQWRKA